MERIVTKPVKLDLHIHSCFSYAKDGDKVKDNTIENLSILYNNLNESQINMIAITDHNVFNYDLYRKIISDIESDDVDTGHLLKCLPGIEFDVEIQGEKIHVIAIFDDKDINKLENIPKIMDSFNFNNKKGNAFTDFKLKEILTTIDLNVALIAHQKSNVTAKMQNDNLSRIGEAEFDKLISVDYFDAVEFRSGKVEGMLTNYKIEHGLDNLRFITGTDCHDWSVYPSQDKTCKQDVTFSYMKSLCTFKGLVMALTEPSRIEIGNYDIKNPFVEELPIIIGGENNCIPLSSGINVIIGDNSIGKSLILEKFFNDKYENTALKIKNGHSEYLERKLIDLGSINNRDEISMMYRGQGGIRKDFQDNIKLKDVDFFKNKFLDIDNVDQENSIKNITNLVWKRIKQNQLIDDSNKKLNYTVNIPAGAEDEHYYLKVILDLKENDTTYKPILDSLKIIKDEITKLSKEKLFRHTEEIKEIQEKIELLYQHYNELKSEISAKNKLIKKISSYSQSYNNENEKVQRINETQIQTFRTNSITSYERIIDAIKNSSTKLIDPLENYKEIELIEKSNPIGEYRFTTRNSKMRISEEEIIKIILFPFKNAKTIDYLNDLTEDNVSDRFKTTETSKFNQHGLTDEKLYEEIILKYCEINIFKFEYLINKEEENLTSGNSPGKNALIFLDVLSQDSNHQVVIIDQPGDDVSQNRISSELIDIIQRMSKNDKQVILVTHKAELVVNLDADNIIIMKELDNGTVEVEYGALEFEGLGFKNNEINVLDDVAEILDGGVETIRRRWKRYDKKSY